MNTVRGTGPLAFPAPNQGPRPLCEPVTTPAPVCEAPANNPLATGELDRTSSYSAAQSAPASLSFTPGGAASVLQKGIQNFDSLSAQEKSQLNQLAGRLGFVNGRNLANSLRHLPADKAAAWLNTLPSSAAAAPEAFAAARSALSTEARGLVQGFFKSRSLPEPRFKGTPELWDGASYLAVFNSLTEMGKSVPAPMLRRLMTTDDGKGLTFERRNQPEPRGESLMQVLSGCMCIAHTNMANKTITLYNPAMSMNPAEIMGRPEVKDFLKQVGRQPPDPKAVESLQNMLRLALPERDLGPKGQLSDKTWRAVYEFQTLQVLKQSLDLVGDDRRLRSDEKKHLSDEIKALIADVRSDGCSNANQLRSLLTRLQRQGLSPAGQERLQTLQRSIPADPVSGGYQRLQPSQLEPLISNWFGMIDSGAQLDFSEQVLNHEFGHLLQGQDQLLENWKQISFAGNETQGQDRTEIMNGTLQEKASGWGVKLAEQFGLNFSNSYGSDYARVNPEEDFAESFRMFTREPARLAADNPLKFAFMAGATGAYEGRERELVTLLRQQGHSDLQLQNMVRILRNQNSAFVGQTTKSYAETGVNFINNVAKVLMPTLAVAEFFGQNPVANTGKSLTESVTQTAVKIADNYTPRFGLNVSTMLPGLESALGMNTRVQAVLPSQPGYVLDWLSRQGELQQSPDAHTAAAARGRLNQFATQGLKALPAEVVAQLPRSERERYSKPEERAVALMLAQIHAVPKQIEALAKSLQQVGAASSQISAAQFERLLGKDLAKALPPAFKALLREPGTLERLSGAFGQIDLDLGDLRSDVEQEVSARTSVFQNARASLSNPESSELMAQLAEQVFVRQASRFSVDADGAELIQNEFRKLFSGLGEVVPELSQAYSAAMINEVLSAVAERLNQQKPKGPSDSSNSDYLKRLGDLLVEELGQRCNPLREAIEIS